MGANLIDAGGLWIDTHRLNLLNCFCSANLVFRRRRIRFQRSLGLKSLPAARRAASLI